MIRLLRRFVELEPALVRSMIGLAVAALLIWGVDLTPLGEQLAGAFDIVGAAVALLAPFWTREAVTPTAAVIARVDDPTAEPGEARYLAGGYADRPLGYRVNGDTALGQVAGQGWRPLWRESPLNERGA